MSSSFPVISNGVAVDLDFATGPGDARVIVDGNDITRCVRKISVTMDSLGVTSAQIDLYPTSVQGKLPALVQLAVGDE